MPPVHFENGQNAKNSHENEKKYDQSTCLLCISKMGKMPKTLMKTRKSMTRADASCAFRKWQNAKNNLKPTNAKKTLMKARKCISGPHASVHFESGEMPKTLLKTTKMYNRATCLCAFEKWAKCQKRLKSIELNKKFHS